MAEDLVGRNLGHYQIIEQLGRGGMATVYKAYQPRLDREVAVKVLPAYFAHDPKFSERFRREAKAIARLDHPNVVPVYDSGEDRGVAYIVMKYVEGGSLKARLNRERLDLALTADIIGQVASGLGYAHGRGIIHRDVKPSNVLMTGADWAQLSDFGIAKITAATQDLTGTGVGVGTPEYMAPEQASEAADVDGRADVYSLGVMLYEMVAGQQPYTGDTPMGVIIKHLQAPLPLVRQVAPEVPETVERIILKAMAKAPEDRFQVPTDLSDALQTFAEGRPVVVEAPTVGGADTSTTLPMVEGALAETAAPHPTVPAELPRRASPVLWISVAAALVAGLALILALAVALPAISRRQEPSDSQGKQEPTPAVYAEEWPVAFHDSFDANENNWDTGDGSNQNATITYLITEGKYRWEVEAHRPIDWFYWNEEVGTFRDFYYSVDVRLVSGPDSAGYGVIFRAIDTAAYVFLVSDPSQEYALLRWDYDRGWTALIDPTRTAAIRRGEANKLTVWGEGPLFMFYINDEQLALYEDDGLTSGRLGLVATLGDAGDFGIFEFDEFDVHAP